MCHRSVRSSQLSKTALLALLLAPVLFTATYRPGLATQANNRLHDPQFIAEGAKLFGPTCANSYCHGAGGLGGGAPMIRERGLDPSYVFKSISNGISGTSMPPFKSELTEEQIWMLVAFIVSDPRKSDGRAPAANPPAPSSSNPPPSAAEAKASASIIGNAEAGKALFFDSSRPKSCQGCHSINGEGTPIGPDLAGSAKSKSPRDLFLSIILKRELKDSPYATITVSLRSGEKIVGVKKEEDVESIRVWDTVELPAVLRTIQKENVSKVEYSNESVMPKDYASVYTMKQLLDLVTYLKSSQSKTSLTFNDLFQ